MSHVPAGTDPRGTRSTDPRAIVQGKKAAARNTTSSKYVRTTKTPKTSSPQATTYKKAPKPRGEPMTRPKPRSEPMTRPKPKPTPKTTTATRTRWTSADDGLHDRKATPSRPRPSTMSYDDTPSKKRAKAIKKAAKAKRNAERKTAKKAAKTAKKAAKRARKAKG